MRNGGGDPAAMDDWRRSCGGPSTRQIERAYAPLSGGAAILNNRESALLEGEREREIGR